MHPEYDLTLYASVESLVLAYFPFPSIHSTPESNTAFQDVAIRGIDGLVDGNYRQVDPIYLRWMTNAIERVRQLKKSTSAMEDFLGDCIRNSKLQPQSTSIPISPRYSKPCSGQFLQFDNSFDLWDNIAFWGQCGGLASGSGSASGSNQDSTSVNWPIWTSEDRELVKWFLEASDPGSWDRMELISSLQGKQISRWERVIDAEKMVDDLRVSAKAGPRGSRNWCGAFVVEMRRLKEWIDGGCIESSTV